MMLSPFPFSSFWKTHHILFANHFPAFVFLVPLSYISLKVGADYIQIQILRVQNTFLEISFSFQIFYKNSIFFILRALSNWHK